MDAIQKIGINYQAMGVYLVNFGLLAAVLGKVLYRPVLRLLDERRETIKKNLEEAENLRESFTEELEKQKEKTNTLVASMERDVERTKNEVKKEATELLKKAEAERSEILKEARLHALEMKDSVYSEVSGEILSHVEQVVSSVLEEKVPEDVVRKSVEEVWDKHYTAGKKKLAPSGERLRD